MFNTEVINRSYHSSRTEINNITNQNPSGIFQRKSMYSRIVYLQFGSELSKQLFSNTSKVKLLKEDVTESERPLYQKYEFKELEKISYYHESPKYDNVFKYYHVPVKVIQVMNSNDNYVLVEYILEPDLEKEESYDIRSRESSLEESNT